MNNNKLAIVCPQVGAPSETFIRKHIELLCPKQTVLLTGAVYNENCSAVPIKIIPIQIGKYSFDESLEREVIQFLKEHSVTHILCEFGCIGAPIIEINNKILKLPIFVHFFGQDASEFLQREDISSYYHSLDKLVNGVIAVSKPMAERLVKIAKIPKEKIKVIHCGVNIPETITTNSEVDHCKFISVSRLVPKKGVLHCLKAFKIAVASVHSITLDIIGYGPLQNEIEQFISANNLSKSVNLLGLRSHEYVLKAYENAGAYVQHSLADPETGNAEGLPVSILEASASGLPVISTLHEGIPEAIEHGVTGYLVKEGDIDQMAEYMIELAKNPALRKKMGIEGHNKMVREGFSTEHMIKEIRAFIGLNKYINTVNTPLSVVFFSHGSSLTGAERSLYDLVRYLKANDVLCTVILPWDGLLKDKFSKIGVSVEVIRYCHWCNSSIKDISLSIETVTSHGIRVIQAINPDIIFTHTNVIPWGAVCANMLGIPHIWSLCEYGKLDYGFYYNYGYRNSMSLIYLSSDIILSITNSVLKECFKHIAPENISTKSEVIYRDAASFFNLSSLNQFDSRKIYPENIICIGLFATIHEGKGQEDLIRAGIKLLTQGYKVNFCFFGYCVQPDYKTNLINLINNSSFKNKYIFKDFLADPLIHMAEMDILVSCSRNEAFGRSIIEALLLKKPLVYANSGGPEEYLTDGEHGLGYEPGNTDQLALKILEIIHKPEEAKKRSEKAYEYVLKTFNSYIFGKKIETKLRGLKGKKIEPSTELYDFLRYGKITDKHSHLFNKKKKLNFFIHSLDIIANNQKSTSKLSNPDRITELTTQLNTIHSSEGWKLLTILYKIRDKLFPQRSVRRKVALKIKNLTVNKK